MVEEDRIYEDEYGFGAAIEYVGVSSCTTITLHLDDDTLLGIHAAVGTTEEILTLLLAQIDQVRALRAVRQIYFVGDLTTFGYERGTGEARGSGWVGSRTYGSAPRLFNAVDSRFRGGIARGGSRCFNHGPGEDRDYRLSAVAAGITLEYRAAGSQAVWTQAAVHRC
ncbi:MAG: hypothetical protein RJQ04_19445 [Longimicrobiales bacterium]